MDLVVLDPWQNSCCPGVQLMGITNKQCLLVISTTHSTIPLILCSREQEPLKPPCQVHTAWQPSDGKARHTWTIILLKYIPLLSKRQYNLNSGRADHTQAMILTVTVMLSAHSYSIESKQSVKITSTHSTMLPIYHVVVRRAEPLKPQCQAHTAWQPSDGKAKHTWTIILLVHFTAKTV